MKVLFYVRKYPPRASGPGIYARNMAQALVTAGHKAVVVTSADADQESRVDEDGVAVYRVEHFGTQTRKGLACVLDIIRTEEVDWIEGVDHQGDAASLLSAKNRPPVVIKSHSCNALKVLRDSLILHSWQKPLVTMSILRNLAEYRREYKSLTKADMLITPSKRMMDEFTRQGLRIPEKRAVIPNPIGLSSGDPQWPVMGNPRKVLFIGRMDIGKGIQYLPGIAKALKGSGAVLKIVGADGYARGLGSLRDWLSAQLSEYSDQVQIIGSVPPDAVSGLMNECSVVVVPSRWDNFPTVILEAMQHGRPVVASPHGGMEEMLQGTGCRVLDPEHDEFAREVRRLIDHPEDVERLGKNMYQKCLKDYSSVKVATDYVRIVSSRLEIAE